MEDVKIIEVAHHRNGVSGESFYAVTFEHGRLRLVGVVFDAPKHVAVFDRDLLGAGVIEFAYNSFRGDVFEGALRAAVAEYETARSV